MNPKVAQSIYLGGTVVSGIVGIALLWGGISSDAANSLNQIIGGLGVLLGGGAANATAAVRTGKQIQNGTLGSAPADTAINAIQQTVQDAQTANADVDRVIQAAGDVLGTVPVFGQLAKQAIESVHVPKF
jgi:hypothetical protein